MQEDFARRSRNKPHAQTASPWAVRAGATVSKRNKRDFLSLVYLSSNKKILVTVSTANSSVLSVRGLGWSRFRVSPRSRLSSAGGQVQFPGRDVEAEASPREFRESPLEVLGVPSSRASRPLPESQTLASDGPPWHPPTCIACSAPRLLNAGH